MIHLCNAFRFNKIFSTTLALFVIGINIYLVVLLVSDLVENTLTHGQGITLIVFATLIGIFYVAFCLYLIIYLAIGMGATWLKRFEVCTYKLQKYYCYDELPIYIIFLYSLFPNTLEDHQKELSG